MRETGPVSKVLAAEDGGDHSPTKPYIGPARTLLGALKNQMQLGGLYQGKMTQRMPDGTLVVAESHFGQDKITIVSPSPEAPPPQQWTPEDVTPPEEPEWSEQLPDLPLEEDQFAVCGYGTFPRDGFTSGNAHAWVWKPGAASVTAIPGPSGARSWWPNAISDNGRVVVGAWISAADDLQRAYRWSAADGAQDLGSTSSVDTRPASATDVNADGSIVVGNGPVASAQHGCSWYWAGAGIHVLAGSSSRPTVAISPSGKYIFSSTSTVGVTSYTVRGSGPTQGSPPFYWLPGYGDIPHAALWEGGHNGYGDPIPIPDASTVQITIFVDGTGNVATPESITQHYSIEPGDVTDNGTVCGTAPYAARCVLGGTVEFITPPGTTNPSGPMTNGAYQFGPDGEHTDAVAITSSGTRVAGNLAVGAYVWTSSQLVRGQPTATDVITAMSRDGIRFCGHSAFVSGQNQDALYWDKGGRVVIPPMPDAVDMRATDVASANHRVPPVPPKPIPLDFAQLDS